MNLTDVVQMVLGIEKKVESLEPLDGRIKALETDLATAKGKAKDAEAELDGIQDLLTASQEAHEDVTSKLKTAMSKIAELTAERDTLKASIDDPAGEIEKRASSKALAITAAQGQAPIGDAPTDDPKQTKISGLKGRDRVIAAFEAQLKL